MFRPDATSPPIGASDIEVLPDLSSPASPALSCAVLQVRFGGVAGSRWLAYSPSDSAWEFADPCPAGRPVLLRNAVAHDGDCFEVQSVSAAAFRNCDISAVLISRTFASLGENCFNACHYLKIVTFEAHSFLCDIAPFAFSRCQLLQSIAIPSSVRLIASDCFRDCRSLGWVAFEEFSRLTTIDQGALSGCESLNQFVIGASVTAVDASAFRTSGIRSIDIEDGSISFKVLNELLVNFEVHSLVWVIGSPESIEIPSSIEELGPWCCASKESLRTVEFASDSHIRSVGEYAFTHCKSLESICIPSSVESLRVGCFSGCSNLRTVTFGAKSKLRRIDSFAFSWCDALKSVSVPASAEIIGQQRITFVPRP
jgi:hypothetical protein